MSKIDLNKSEMDFDDTSLYPSAMWDKNGVYPKIETGYVFKPHMNNVFLTRSIIKLLIKMVMIAQFQI